MNPDVHKVNRPKSPTAKVIVFVKSVAIFVLGLGVLGFYLFIGSESFRTIPDSAIVYVDEESKTYFSPPLLRTDSRDFCTPARYSCACEKAIPVASSEVEAMIKVVPPDPDDIIYIDLKREVFAVLPIKGARVVVPMKNGEIRGKREFSPDLEHRDKSGFIDKPRGWFGCAMEMVGFQKPRWTESGEWNW
ncbi:hypothetical protein RAS2_00520 [Phycisphaerae bacterium RAS2]|nr:hypothetical protein RAS2_00520 [Phycisphaerae bacterium RAS2]